MQQRKWLTAGLVTLLAGVVLAGCGNTSSNSSNAKDQTINLAASSPLDTIDISKAGGYGQTGNVFESFYRLGKNGSIQPGLATSSSVSKDGKTWTFKLRNAKWSDGSAITAKDFVYSWRRTVTPSTKAQYAYLFNGVKNASEINKGKLSPDKLGIEAVNDHEVKITLDKPIAYFKNLMTYPIFGPESQKVVDKYGKKYATNSSRMVYSGPFKIVKWNGTGNTWSYVKNDQYWDSKVVKLKKINYSVVSNPTTSLNLYNTGKLDLTQLSTEELKNYRNDKNLHDYSYAMTIYLQYNFKDSDAKKRKALGNENIRRAISLAVDRNLLSKKVLGLKSPVTTGFIPHGLASDPKTGQDFAEQQKVANTTNYNLKLAKQLWAKGLKEIGEKNVSLSIMAPNDNGDDQSSSTVVQYLKGVLEKNLNGFHLTIDLLPSKSTSDNAQKGNFDIYLNSWGADFKDPITFLQIPQTGTSYNNGKYSNKQYDALVDRADDQDANNPEQRWQDLVKAAQLLNKDQGITPLFQNNTYYLQKSSLKDVIHNNAGPQWTYKYASVK